MAAAEEVGVVGPTVVAEIIMVATVVAVVMAVGMAVALQVRTAAGQTRASTSAAAMAVVMIKAQPPSGGASTIEAGVVAPWVAEVATTEAVAAAAVTAAEVQAGTEAMAAAPAATAGLVVIRKGTVAVHEPRRHFSNRAAAAATAGPEGMRKDTVAAHEPRQHHSNRAAHPVHAQHRTLGRRHVLPAPALARAAARVSSLSASGRRTPPGLRNGKRW